MDVIELKRKQLVAQCGQMRQACAALAHSTASARNGIMERLAHELTREENAAAILAANAMDVAAAKENGIGEVMVDRLTLTAARLAGIAASLRKVAMLRDPLDRGENWRNADGLDIRRIRVPLGICAMIYESRPNVTVDAAALCLKSGNAVILRGGKEAVNSNMALVKIIKSCVGASGLSPELVHLIEDTTRESTQALMGLEGCVDVIIPRGGVGLIKMVKENSKIPVIETGAGNCHVYVHADADLEMAEKIIVNAKAQRPSVCNAAETLLVHSDIAETFLPRAKKALEEKKVELRGDERTRKIIEANAACEEDYFTEYNDYILAVKIVDNLEEAVAHINRHNTRHSEAIVTRSLDAARAFQTGVDAVAVYVNASTRFTDGEVFGFGAEIGISTSKLHASGPFGLDELTTVKYLIEGEGHIRK